MLPCEAGLVNFFVEPYGDVFPCNGLEDGVWKQSMGNIREVSDFNEIWHSQLAKEVRERVAKCPKNCWMVGTAAPVMKKHIKHPALWVAKNKLRSVLGQGVCTSNIPWFNVGQNPLQGDLNVSRMEGFNDNSGVKPDKNLPLIED